MNERVPYKEKCVEWKSLLQIPDDMYIYCNAQNSNVRYAPLYIHRFLLISPYKILEATLLEQQYVAYDKITTIPDRLRWCRHSRGLMQREVAEIAGVGRAVYNEIERGGTRQIPQKMILNLSKFYGVPVSDFMDEFNNFLFDGQAERIKAYRKKLGMGRKPFCRATGIPLSSLRGWEDGTKRISMKSWERYFKGKA